MGGELERDFSTNGGELESELSTLDGENNKKNETFFLFFRIMFGNNWKISCTFTS